MTLLRAIIQGQPGSGKTSLFASAANAGYRVILADFDRCSEPLFAYTTPEGKKHLEIKTFNSHDQFDKFLDKKAEWNPNTILALDSLTEMAPYTEEYAATLNNNTDPRMLIYQTGKELENICRKMKKLPCHIVVVSHLRLVSPHVESGYIDRGGQYRGQDTALQRQVKMERAKLEETAFYPNIPSENVARNFIHLFPFALLVEEDGSAKNVSGRIVRTTPVPGYQIKCPIAGIAVKLPIETSLLTILAGIGDELALAALTERKVV